jgi:hypothetical protein
MGKFAHNLTFQGDCHERTGRKKISAELGRWVANLGKK